ncbi:MAG: XylR N-terminal domain-containing protein [bacterium]|nr:XylR N-terminal domain-containing protein [bacterium]
MPKTFRDISQIQFHPEQGQVLLQNNRVLVMTADSIGLLRNEIIQSLGLNDARKLFLRFGYQNGYADFLQLKLINQDISEKELLLLGPAIHSLEGIVLAIPDEVRFNRETGEFYFTGTWKNSYEAEQHLHYNPLSSIPVCWSLVGYASGWCSAFWGKPLLAMEPKCVAKGDEHCAWCIQPIESWGNEANYIKSALSAFF